MDDALAAGRMPTRAELAAWSFADGAQQLSFAELLVELQTSRATELLEQVRQHADGVREMLAFIRQPPDPDRARADALQAVLTAHAGQRAIAFSEYADTVAALYRLLAPNARAAMLTHGGGRVAGGRLTRRELLRRFSSGASTLTAESDRIDLLLTTDVLSEGVDLQDASVVVHLDLSWNPARLAQRVGRLRRPGAARDEVTVYLFAPPVAAERLLQIERRLRVKLGVAARSLGIAGAILPGLDRSATAVDAPTPCGEQIESILQGWRTDAATCAMEGTMVATTRAPRDGAIACVRTGDDVALVAITGATVTDDRVAIAPLLESATGESVETDEPRMQALHDRVQRWVQQRSASTIVDLPSLHVANSRRTLLRRVDTIARRAPRHSQPKWAPLMRAVRTAATATLTAGAERVLEELASAPLNDEAWLHAIGEFSALHARARGSAAQIVALLVLQRTDAVSGSRSR